MVYFAIIVQNIVILQLHMVVSDALVSVKYCSIWEILYILLNLSLILAMFEKSKKFWQAVLYICLLLLFVTVSLVTLLEWILYLPSLYTINIVSLTSYYFFYLLYSCSNSEFFQFLNPGHARTVLLLLLLFKLKVDGFCCAIDLLVK